MVSNSPLGLGQLPRQVLVVESSVQFSGCYAFMAGGERSREWEMEWMH
jgi:hypothetical protein